MNLQFNYLIDSLEHLETVSSWLFHEWGHFFPQYKNEEEYLIRIKERLQREKIPTIFVISREKEPMGTTSLLWYDLKTHKHFSPWLAGVYVKPEARGEGVGKVLVNKTTHEARRIGVKRLYLFTFDKEAFYSKLGWETIEVVEFQKERVMIMAIDQ